MSEFVKSLLSERARLVLIAEPAELPAAIARRAEAREAYRAAVESRSSREDQRHELMEATTAAEQVVADLERAREQARGRIKEIDRMATAADDATRHRIALTEKNASIVEVRDRISQLIDIGAALDGEIADLNDKRGTVLAEHGRAELAARLSGKSMQPPKAIAAIDADLESRNAALAAAHSAKEESETLLTKLAEEAEQIRRQLSDAQQRRAELEYYEALPALLPIVARLMASGSGLGYSQSGAFEIHCNDETLRAARAAFEAELA